MSGPGIYSGEVSGKAALAGRVIPLLFTSNMAHFQPSIDKLPCSEMSGALGRRWASVSSRVGVRSGFGRPFPGAPVLLAALV